MGLGIKLGFYNLIKCSGTGWEDPTSMFNIGGDCSMAKLGAVILFFILAIVRKWGGEEMGLEFSMLWSEVIGLLSYFAIVTFTGSFKLALLVGLILGIAAGYGSGFFMESTGGESG